MSVRPLNLNRALNSQLFRESDSSIPFLELPRTGDLTKYQAEQEKTRAEQERQPASNSIASSNCFFSAFGARDLAMVYTLTNEPDLAFQDRAIWRGESQSTHFLLFGWRGHHQPCPALCR
jgi:hypothetical protein